MLYIYIYIYDPINLTCVSSGVSEEISTESQAALRFAKIQNSETPR